LLDFKTKKPKQVTALHCSRVDGGNAIE